METVLRMAEEKHEKRNSEDEVTPEERYRYIGFNVFPGKAQEFWKTDEERKAHTEKIRETGGKFVPLTRSNSLVAARAMSPFERWTLVITSALMAASPFLPWFSFTRGTENLSYSGISLLMNVGSVRGFLALGPGLLSTSFYMLLALMLISSALGFASLYMLFAGGGSDDSLTRLHKLMNWCYLPIAGWMVFFGLAMLPTELPYGQSLGLAEVGNEYGMGALTAASSMGLWIPMGALWVNAIKGNDL